MLRADQAVELLLEPRRLDLGEAASDLLGDLGSIMFHDSANGRLVWQIFGGTLRYAAGLVPEIADDIVNIDNAIRWGFNWVNGPFEMLDAIGPARVIAKIRAEGDALPAMLQVLADSGSATFYQVSPIGERRYLGRDGVWRPTPN